MHAASTPSTPRNQVGSVVQAVTILRHLGVLTEGAGVTAIARATGIGPSSCFNVLRTLLAEDLVNFDPATKHYTLGLGTIDLARLALGRDALVSAAQARMARLAERHDAAVGLWRLAHGRLALVALAESAAATRIHMVVGQRQPASAGATGRAVLAAQGSDNQAVLEAYAGARWRSPPGAEIFLHQVREAERRGWAEDIGNINHGIATVASAIIDASGAVRFVLSASIFDGREGAAGMDVIGSDLCAVAHQLASAVYGQEKTRESMS